MQVEGSRIAPANHRRWTSHGMGKLLKAAHRTRGRSPTPTAGARRYGPRAGSRSVRPRHGRAPGAPRCRRRAARPAATSAARARGTPPGPRGPLQPPPGAVERGHVDRRPDLRHPLRHRSLVRRDRQQDRGHAEWRRAPTSCCQPWRGPDRRRHRHSCLAQPFELDADEAAERRVGGDARHEAPQLWCGIATQRHQQPPGLMGDLAGGTGARRRR